MPYLWLSNGCGFRTNSFGRGRLGRTKMAITAKSTRFFGPTQLVDAHFRDANADFALTTRESRALHLRRDGAHLRRKAGASRNDASQTPVERDDYANLVLLCPNHHTLIDKPENEKKYTVAVLQKMKSDHEGFGNGRLAVQKFNDKREVASYVYPLLKENHDVFLSYGPKSEIARKNPESDAHGVWLSEKVCHDCSEQPKDCGDRQSQSRPVHICGTGRI